MYIFSTEPLEFNIHANDVSRLLQHQIYKSLKLDEVEVVLYTLTDCSDSQHMKYGSVPPLHF